MLVRRKRLFSCCFLLAWSGERYIDLFIPHFLFVELPRVICLVSCLISLISCVCVVRGTARRQSSLIASIFFFVFVCVSVSICLPTCQTYCLSDDSGRDEIEKEEAKQMKTKKKREKRMKSAMMPRSRRR